MFIFPSRLPSTKCPNYILSKRAVYARCIFSHAFDLEAALSSSFGKINASRINLKKDERDTYERYLKEIPRSSPTRLPAYEETTFASVRERVICEAQNRKRKSDISKYYGRARHAPGESLTLTQSYRVFSNAQITRAPTRKMSRM